MKAKVVENSILIIPMAGKGSRFESAGYSTYKPFIKFNEKSMLDRVIEPFKEFQEIFIITTKKIFDKNDFFIKKLQSNIKFILIKAHKLGPAYSIFLAINELPKNKSIFISYCDVWWHSNQINFDNIALHEAAIFTHKGFHPHLIKDNFSAFCKSSTNDSTKLAQIKEKGSFTNNWMNESLSIGVFFVREPEIFYDSICKFINNNKKIAGEFYPSVIFNDLINYGLNVQLIEVDTFAHVGLPSHLKDLEFWSNIINNDKRDYFPMLEDTFQHCMLIGGSGTRMKKISETPKHFLPVKGVKMFEFIARKFKTKMTKIVASPDFNFKESNDVPFLDIKLMKSYTNSHLETLTYATFELVPNKPILFSSCDCFGDLNISKMNLLINKYNPDSIVFSFEPSLLNSKNIGQHTKINFKNQRLIDIDIKSKNDIYTHGLAGFFWFKNKELIHDELKTIEHDNESELLIDHLIKSMIRNKRKIFCMPIDPYIHLGTPDEYNEFLYWNGRGKILIS